MKLLFDENLSPRLARQLLPMFPGSIHVDDVGLAGKPDAAIWDYARLFEFTIVSKDNDFRQRAFLFGPLPKVIWLSVGDRGTNAVAALLEESVARIAAFALAEDEGLLVLASD